VFAIAKANIENIKSFQGTIKIEAEVSENKNKEYLDLDMVVIGESCGFNEEIFR